MPDVRTTTDHYHPVTPHNSLQGLFLRGGCESLIWGPCARTVLPHQVVHVYSTYMLHCKQRPAPNEYVHLLADIRCSLSSNRQHYRTTVANKHPTS